MANDINLGNVVGLLRSQVAPVKKYVLWAKILNPALPDIVELHYWDDIAGAWVALLDPTHQYWLRPVIDNETDTPPASPSEGDRYLIPPGSTGAWAGKTDQIAYWKGGAWQFVIPLDGYIVSVRSKPNELYDFRGVYGSGEWAVNDFSIPVTADQYIPLIQKGAALGVAPLDSSTRLVSSFLYPDTIGYNPANAGDWPVGTDTIKKALDHIIGIAGTGGSSGVIPGLEDVLDESPDGGGLAIQNVLIDASLITSGTINIARLPQAALERMYTYVGGATLPENAGLTSGLVQNGDTVKLNSTGRLYLVLDENNLNQPTSFEPYTAGTASTVPWSGVTSTPTTAGGYGIQAAAYSVIGRATGTLGTVGDITASSDNTILRRSGTSIGFGTILPQSIGNISASSLLGRNSDSSGTAEQITLGSGLSMTGNVLSSTGILGGSGNLNELAYWSSSIELTSHAAMLFDPTSGRLNVSRFKLDQTAGAWATNLSDGEIMYDSNADDFKGRINGFWGAFTRPEEITEPDTTFTLDETHRNCLVRCTNNNPITITLPVTLQRGFVVTIVKSGTGNITVNTPGTYVGVSNQILIQNVACTFYYSGSSVWRGYGSLGAAGLGSGTVTLVNINNIPNFITWTGGPITGNGSFTGTLNTQDASKLLMGPIAGAAPAIPAFRYLLTADLPDAEEVLVTGTSYIISKNDNKKIIRCTHASGCNITLPETSGPSLIPVGATFTVVRQGGLVSFITSGTASMAGVGYSIVSPNSGASIWHRAANTYVIMGALTTTTGSFAFSHGITETSPGVIKGGGTITDTYELYSDGDANRDIFIGKPLVGFSSGSTARNVYVYGRSVVTLASASGLRFIQVTGTGIQLLPTQATAFGDMWYSGADAYMIRIPIGTPNQVFTVGVSGIPGWASPAAGTTYVAGSGITFDTGNVIRAGTPIGTYTTQNIHYQMGAGNIFSVFADNSGTTAFMGVTQSQPVSYIGITSGGITHDVRIAPTTGVVMGYANSSTSAAMNIEIKGGNNSIIVKDTLNNRGLTYQVDYSANYINLSIPHVGYTNSRLGGKALSSLITTPTASQHGHVVSWDNTNLRYTLTAGGGGGGSGSVTSVAGTSNRITISGTPTVAPIVDIASTYVGQASITTLGTIGTGTWQGSTIATTYTSAKVVSITGQANRIVIGGTSTAPTVSLASNYVGQNTIITLGTITTGVWQGTTIGFTRGGTGLSSIGAANTILSTNSGATGLEYKTGTQVTALLDIFTTSVKGLVPAASGGSTTTQFLRKDGSWAVPAGGGGGITNGAAANEIMRSDGTNAVASGVFITPPGNIIMGSASIAGGRSFSVASSDTDADLTIATKGHGDLILALTASGELIVGNGAVSGIRTIRAGSSTVNAELRIMGGTNANSPVSIGTSQPISLYNGNISTNGNLLINVPSGYSITLGNFNDNNIALLATPPSFNGATGMVYIANRGALASADPITGGYLYAEAGALKWRGSNGTVTTIANA